MSFLIDYPVPTYLREVLYPPGYMQQSHEVEKPSTRLSTLLSATITEQREGEVL